jgi:CheY-like chemotaxis protein
VTAARFLSADSTLSRARHLELRVSRLIPVASPVARALLFPPRMKSERSVTRVLLVAEEAEQRHKAAGALTGWGCDVVEAGSGVELIAALWMEGPFDAIITSAQLPDMSALEVLAGLRGGSGPSLGEARFVVVAGKNDRIAHELGSTLQATVIDAPLNREKLGLAATGPARRAA